MKRVLGWIMLLAGLAGLWGCGHPFIPASALKQAAASPANPAAQSPANPAAQPSANPAAPSSPSPGPGRPGAPEVGVDLYAASGYPMSLVRRDGTRILTYIRDTLRPDGVAIMWNLCSPSAQSTRVYRCAGTLRPAAVSLLARLARRDGLAVQMRPIIRVGPVSRWNVPAQSWEGFLNPGNQPAFFASLLRAERPYLLAARRYHAQAFIAASELQGLLTSPSWPGFIRRVHAVCGCAARYSFTGVLRGGGAADLDAYPRVQLPTTISQARLDQAWVRWLGQFPRPALRQASIDEVSIPAEENAYHHPAIWNAASPADPTAQARWFTAACRAAAHYKMRGIWFYEINLIDNPSSPSSFPAFFEGRAPSEAAIRSCRR